MPKFIVKVARVEEYEINIDENVFTQEQLNDLSQTFSEDLSNAAVAEMVAWEKFSGDPGSLYLHNLGYIKTNGRILENYKYVDGIELKVISETPSIDIKEDKV